MAQTNTDLVLNFSICQKIGCRDLTFEESTPLYSSIDLTGWGAPNPELIDVLSYNLIFTSPSDEIYNVNLLTAFPTITPVLNQELTVTNSMLGFNTSFEDGLWTITLKAEGIYTDITDTEVAFSTSTTKYFFFTCQTQCKLDKMLAKITADECSSCNDTILKQVINAQMYLNAANAAACCGQSNKAAKLLARANFIAAKNGCSNC